MWNRQTVSNVTSQGVNYTEALCIINSVAILKKTQSTMDEMVHIQLNRGSIIFVKRERCKKKYLPLSTRVVIGQKWICFNT